MTEFERIVTELRNAHTGDPWHGPSRAAVLADVTAEEAHRSPGPQAHSIWSLVLHMRSWTREVSRRLREGNKHMPDDGDYPSPPVEPSEAAWRADVASLDHAHAELLASVVAVGDDGLDVAIGSGATKRVTLHGLAQHDAYHSGQIAILKKIYRG